MPAQSQTMFAVYYIVAVGVKTNLINLSIQLARPFSSCKREVWTDQNVSVNYVCYLLVVAVAV